MQLKQYTWRRAALLLLAASTFTTSACLTTSVPAPLSSEQRRDNDDVAGYILAETAQNGGITYDLKAGRKVEIGTLAFAVSLVGGKVIAAGTDDTEKEKVVREMLEDVGGDLRRGIYMLGTWVDEHGITYVDRTQLVPYTAENEPVARAQALQIGRENAQQTIFDLGSGEVIPVP